MSGLTVSRVGVARAFGFVAAKRPLTSVDDRNEGGCAPMQDYVSCLAIARPVDWTSRPLNLPERLGTDAAISVRQIGSISGLRFLPWAKD
jgi:hypothetical protein